MRSRGVADKISPNSAPIRQLAPPRPPAPIGGGAMMMNVSLKMNITTSGGAHNGIFVTTGIQTAAAANGAYGGAQRSSAANAPAPQFYDARDMLEMWRGASAQNAIAMLAAESGASSSAVADAPSAVESIAFATGDNGGDATHTARPSTLDFTPTKRSSPPPANRLPATDASSIAALLSPLKSGALDVGDGRHSPAAEANRQRHHAKTNFPATPPNTSAPPPVSASAAPDATRQEKRLPPHAAEKSGDYDYSDDAHSSSASTAVRAGASSTAAAESAPLRYRNSCALPPLPRRPAAPGRQSHHITSSSTSSLLPPRCTHYSTASSTAASTEMTPYPTPSRAAFQQATSTNAQIADNLHAYDAEPYGTFANRKANAAAPNAMSRSYDEELMDARRAPIRLNVFEQEDGQSSAASRAGVNSSAVELYIPAQVSGVRVPGFANADGDDESETESVLLLNDTTTTTTTVEIFREPLDDARRPVDYFRLPRPPLGVDAHDGLVDLVRAHGAPYEIATRTETHFGGDRRTGRSRAGAGGGSAQKVRWDDTQTRPYSASSSQPSLKYVVREPSSLSSSMYTMTKSADYPRDRADATQFGLRPGAIAAEQNTDLCGFEDEISAAASQRRGGDAWSQQNRGLPEPVHYEKRARATPSRSRIDRYRPESAGDRPASRQSAQLRPASSQSDAKARSSPSFSSVWNLEDEISDDDAAADNEVDVDDSASVATILRYQQRQRSVERLRHPRREPGETGSAQNLAARGYLVAPPSRASASENEEVVYSRIITPQPGPTLETRYYGSTTPQICPPIPPKRFPMRRTTSQPNFAIENADADVERAGERRAPPRPRTQKPPPARFDRQPLHFGAHGPPPPPAGGVFDFRELPTPQARRNRAPDSRRSASSNEIFKLYQTRDCLGNVLYEV